MADEQAAAHRAGVEAGWAEFCECELDDPIEHKVERATRAALIAAERAASQHQICLIWSNLHRMWWRADSKGYARTVDEAGRYTHAEAIEICRSARDGWDTGTTPTEIPVRLVDIAVMEGAHALPAAESTP